MRLTEVEKTVITEEVLRRDPLAQIYLYGSRVDDQLRGGDIDLLVISAVIGLAQKIDILVSMKLRMGDQRIDLLIENPGHATPFSESVKKMALRLN